MVNNKYKIVAQSVALLLLLAVTISGCAILPGSSDEPTSVISVTGTGTASGQPDMATVQLGVSTVNADLPAAIEEVSRLTDAVHASAIALGVAPEDIRTTNFSTWPEEVYSPQTGMPTGERTYHVDSTVEVAVRNVDDLGAVINAGLDAGANNVFGIQFGLQDTTPLEDEARVLATEDAKTRAMLLANAAGVELGDLISVSEGSAGYPAPYPVYEYGIGGGGGGVPISPGQADVTLRVQMVYEILGP
jgi:uncharacterized protein YggE